MYADVERGKCEIRQIQIHVKYRSKYTGQKGPELMPID